MRWLALHPRYGSVRGALLGAVLAMSGPGLCWGWGDIGHFAIAEIAVTRLSQTARAEIEKLLPGGLKEFVDIATWADDVIEEWPESYPWHSVDIPHHATGYDRQRDCRDDDCIVERIKLFAVELSDRSGPKEKRVVALKMLIHLVGDLHMPLHAYQPDRSWEGWEGPWVQIEDTVEVLHFWWDNLLIFEIGPDAQGVAEELIQNNITIDDEATWTSSGPEIWANESFLIARDFIVRHNLTDVARWVTYTEDYPLVLAAHVREETRAIIARQVAKAGVRLAALLNRAFE